MSADRFPSDAEPGSQNSLEWLMARVGHCTASNFAAVLDKTKAGKESAKRRNYRVKLVVERLINRPTDNYVSVAMQHGIDTEPLARMAYESATGAIVEETGFIKHPAIEWCGGSPDGLIGAQGGVEIKCPWEPSVYVEALMTNDISDYLPQVHGLLWITGRAWWDLMLFDPRMPPALQHRVWRIERDPAYLTMLEAEVIAFLAEVKEQHHAVMTLAGAT